MNFKSLLNVSETVGDFMTKVYSLTFIGTLISLAVGFATFSTPVLLAFVTGHSILLFAFQIAVIFGLSYTSSRSSPLVNLLMYAVFVGSIGLTLGYVFLTYTFASIFTSLLSVSVMFGVLTVYGYFTKTDLSPYGKFFLIALVGIIVASIINVFFISSSVMTTVISIVGLLVFAGLVSYDTQKIKNTFVVGETTPVFGAVSLYLNFINLLTFFLELFGIKK